MTERTRLIQEDETPVKTMSANVSRQRIMGDVVCECPLVAFKGTPAGDRYNIIIN